MSVADGPRSKKEELKAGCRVLYEMEIGKGLNCRRSSARIARASS
jgi:hypothetical protein